MIDLTNTKLDKNDLIISISKQIEIVYTNSSITVYFLDSKSELIEGNFEYYLEHHQAFKNTYSYFSYWKIPTIIYQKNYKSFFGFKSNDSIYAIKLELKHCKTNSEKDIDLEHLIKLIREN